MSNAFVRPAEAADRGKKLDAELLSVDGLEVYQLRVQVMNAGTAPDYALRMDSPDADTLYIGEALPGTAESAEVWRVKKILTVGAVTKLLWAGGESAFAYSWTDRLALTYI